MKKWLISLIPLISLLLIFANASPAAAHSGNGEIHEQPAILCNNAMTQWAQALVARSPLMPSLAEAAIACIQTQSGIAGAPAAPVTNPYGYGLPSSSPYSYGGYGRPYGYSYPGGYRPLGYGGGFGYGGVGSRCPTGWGIVSTGGLFPNLTFACQLGVTGLSSITCPVGFVPRETAINPVAWTCEP